MRKVRFYLNPTGSILGRFNYKDKVFKYGTGLKVEAKFWDSHSQRVKSTKSFPLNVPYNLRLNRIEETIQKVYYEALAAGMTLTRDSFISRLDPQPEDQNMPLMKFVEAFVNERKGTGNFAAGTYKAYNTVFNKLLKFSQVIGKELSYEDMNLSFFFGFTKFLNDSGYKTNYVDKIITNLKVMLNDAKERGFNPFEAFKSRKFSVGHVKTKNIYLNEKELLKLYDHEFSTEYLRNAADLFLLGAWSSFRDSDFRKLIQENVEMYKGKEIIKIQSVKTKKAVAVPLHAGIKEIIKRRGFPRPISQQKLNNFIKSACREAGIDQKVLKYESRAGGQTQSLVPKYELVTSHTARRSFATNMFLRGYPVSLIKEFMGHSSEKMTWAYICATEEESAFRVAGDEFFKIC